MAGSRRRWKSILTLIRCPKWRALLLHFPDMHQMNIFSRLGLSGRKTAGLPSKVISSVATNTWLLSFRSEGSMLCIAVTA